MANKQSFSTKQETGYADPLSDCADFNILNFINSSDAPDSPYCQQYASMNGNGVHLEQQQMQQRQQMPNANHIQQMQHGRQMHPVILDNGLMYNNGTTQLPDSPPITGKHQFCGSFIAIIKRAKKHESSVAQ
jgi:hypothetical protein